MWLNLWHWLGQIAWLPSFVFDALDHYSSPYRAAGNKWDSPRNGTNVMELLVLGGTANMTVLLIGLFSLLILYANYVNWLVKEAFYMTLKPVEFGGLVLPVILMVSYLNRPAEQMQVLCVIILLIIAFVRALRPTEEKRKEYEKNMVAHCQIIYSTSYIPWLTNYRAIMLITTSVCILAVDFPIFPIRLAKTVYWGQSLMDAGVGSFVFASGILCQEARRGLQNSYLTKVIKECVPLIILGLLRILLVKSTGYNEEVIEYGTHWNFFFTMAFCKLVASVFLRCSRMKHTWAASAVVAIAHEILLVDWIDAAWVLSPNTPRDTFIAANREGMVSLLGYVAIYLAGVWLGQVICEKQRYDQELNSNLSLRISLHTSILWLVLCIIHYNEWFIPNCRRLASANYVLWIVTYNMTLLLLFLVIDTFLTYFCDIYGTPSQPPPPPDPYEGQKARGKAKRRTPQAPPPPPPLEPEDWPSIDSMPYDGNPPHLDHRIPPTLQAIAKNGLAYFLLANLLTGIINHYVLTHSEEDDQVALTYLIGYMAVLHLAAICSYYGRWSLKFW